MRQLMNNKINEEVLCILKKNAVTNQIEIDYVTIEMPLAKTIDNFSALLDDPNSTLEQVINFIKSTEELNLLTAYYRYCVYLSGSYQAFSANNQDTIKEIVTKQQLMQLNQENAPEKYDINKAIADYKNEIKNKYILWHNAYSINKTYRLCHEDKSIMTFSHRIDGWSDPVYQLTPNFSVEIKTNFGYGRASYFYTKLKYKNIEITPFSEWTDYEFAKFSEIVRYSKSHSLKNEYWLEAMEYSRDACNLSLEDEVKFVEKYIIDECEKMTSGLEEIFNKEQFSFKNRCNKNERITVDKKGHVLVEFRGEKISGALDFISKILEFEKITSIKSFIERIEECNKKIQPILAEESAILKVKIENLTKEKNQLQPQYDEVVMQKNEYNQKKVTLKEELFTKEQLDNFWSSEYEHYRKQLEAEFIKRWPEYTEFEKEYKQVTDKYRILIEQIQNHTKVRDNIISYNEKIIKYFGK